MKKKSPHNPAPELDFYSVHRLPNAKASVAFVPKTSEIFREMEHPELRTYNGHEYVPWGADDMLPYNIIKLIKSDETLSTCQIFNAEVCYGSGLKYCTEAASAAVRSEVDDFLFDNSIPEYFLGVCQDLKHFNFAVSVIILNADGSKIVQVVRKNACYCRFARADKFGRIPKVLYANFRHLEPSDHVEEIDLLDPVSPWLDLQRRVGRLTRPDGSRRDDGVRKFAVLSRFPGVDSLYYPVPHYASLFKGAWFNIKQLIGTAKMAKLKNAAPIKYVIEVSKTYWDNLFIRNNIVGHEEQRKFLAKRKQEMMEFLTDVENSGNVLFTEKSMSIDGKSENPEITVNRIDSNTKEGGDWESDIAEAVNMICFVMRVHSNLVGSVPGKSQTNNSGSDKRELYTIAQALQKPYHDLLFRVHEIIIRFNGWTGVHPDCPFIQLTTLDEHADAKEVTANPKPEKE